VTASGILDAYASTSASLQHVDEHALPDRQLCFADFLETSRPLHGWSDGAGRGEPQDGAATYAPVPAEVRLEGVVPARASGKLSDAQMRSALHVLLQERHRDSDTLVLNEMAVAYGYSKMDVAVLNGRLEGYEIKSDRDTLARLDHQLFSYRKLCDFLTIVTTERHRAAVLKVVPDWCGVAIATADEHQIRYTTLREARLNPERDLHALLRQLRLTETRRLAQIFGFRAPKIVNKLQVHDFLADHVQHDDLRRATLGILRLRRWTARQTQLRSKSGDRTCLPCGAARVDLGSAREERASDEAVDASTATTRKPIGATDRQPATEPERRNSTPEPSRSAR
jgi:hypothetical protein